MRDDDHDAPSIGQLAEQSRHRAFVARVESRRRLVEEQHRRPGEQLESDRRPLLLTAGEAIDRDVAPLGQPQLVEHLGHASVALNGIGVRAKAQRGGVGQRPAQRQVQVQNLVLRDMPDPVAELGKCPVQILAVVGYHAAGCRADAGQRVEQRALAGARRSDDGSELAWLED